jgi:hypothetical protein
MTYQTPDLSRRAFASTNAQTIAQRVGLLQELVPEARTIAELCCGDCSRQWHTYTSMGTNFRFLGLDIEPNIVAHNRTKGIPCIQGDVLDKTVLAQFRDFDVVFFGPPLSQDCDGHHLLAFREIVPAYRDVAQLLLGELTFNGMFICICPKTTSMGDINWLYEQIRHHRSDVGLRLIHYSYSTLRGNGKTTPMRLKYIELWFSSALQDAWEIRINQPDTEGAGG